MLAFVPEIFVFGISNTTPLKVFVVEAVNVVLPVI